MNRAFKSTTMKKIIIGTAFFAASALITLNRCTTITTKKDTTGKTVISTIGEDPTLKIFSTIVGYSGDDLYLNNSDAVVIPVDSAFINAGITQAKVASRLSPPQCDSIVMFYTIYDGINFARSAGKKIGFQSGLDTPLWGDSTYSGIFFNGVAAFAPYNIGKTRIFKLTRFIPLPTQDAMANNDY